MTSNYQFLFAGGSCGSFVKNIFAYYLFEPKIKIDLSVNPISGDAHGGNNPIEHHHYVESLDAHRPVIAIDFDDDDRATIVKMVFHKNTYNEILTKPEILKVNWFGKLQNIDPHDVKSLEQVFLDDPGLLVFQDWTDSLEMVKPVLIITFKQVLFGELHKIITDFLHATPVPEIDEYIKNYREINKKYL